MNGVSTDPIGAKSLLAPICIPVSSLIVPVISNLPRKDFNLSLLSMLSSSYYRLPNDGRLF